MGGDLRRVGERLVVQARQERHDVHRLARCDVQLGVLRAEVPRDRLGMSRFVIAVLVEADGERLHRPAALRLHQRDHGRRVDPAREERAERHVGDHLPGDRLPEQRIERARRRFVAARERLGETRSRRLLDRPIGTGRRVLRPRKTLGGERKVRGRRQLAHAAIDRPGRRDVAVAQVQRERLAIDLGPEPRMGAQRLQLRTEHERVARPAVIERLLAEPIAGEVHRSLARVPERKGEHADQPLERALDAPGGERGEHHLGVGVASPRRRVALLFERRAQREVVIDLAVEDDHVAPVGRGHRLVTLRREVEDREPPEAECDAGLFVDPDTLVVRAAESKRGRHRARPRGERVARGSLSLPAAGYPAHGLSLFHPAA
jgi:hypothetical protein